jgi:hypothetical protein
VARRTLREVPQYLEQVCVTLRPEIGLWALSTFTTLFRSEISMNDVETAPARASSSTAFLNRLLVFCPANNFTQALEFSEDGFGGGGPFEGTRMLIPVGDKAIDLSAQIRDRGE